MAQVLRPPSDKQRRYPEPESWTRLGLQLSDGSEADLENLVIPDLDLSVLMCFHVQVGLEIENSPNSRRVILACLDEEVEKLDPQ